MTDTEHTHSTPDVGRRAVLGGAVALAGPDGFGGKFTNPAYDPDAGGEPRP